MVGQGRDLVKGLGESVRVSESGDVDLNDGALAKLREVLACTIYQ